MFEESFYKIVYKSNQIELFYELSLLTQLSFGAKICISLRDDKEFIKFLNENVKNIANFNIQKVYHALKWNLYDKDERSKKLKNTDQPKESKQVMLSYCTEDQVTQEFCIKIKQKLESESNQVFLQNESVYDLETVVNAIEESYCCILFVNEKYRQSIQCQIEARYAYEINKPILSIILQKGYESVREGWLSIILQATYCINFQKYKFEECMRILEQKVALALVGNLSHSKVNQTNIEKDDEGGKPPDTYTESEVILWLKRNNIDPKIIDFLQTCSCDGTTLQQIYFMKINDPQFYNYSFKQIDNLSFLSLVKFSGHLDSLFVVRAQPDLR